MLGSLLYISEALEELNYAGVQTLGGGGVLAYTNPSRNFVELIPFQTSDGPHGLRQREDTRSRIKGKDSHNNNPPPSSITSIDPKFHTKTQARADAQKTAMKISIISTIAACLLPMATKAASTEGAHGLAKREYAFHASLTARVSVQAGVLIALFIQLSKSVFNAAHN